MVPFKCSTCKQTFARKVNLESHVRIHTGEKPYKCDICGNRFRNCSNLKEHRRIHTGERPYKCRICNEAFFQSNHLQKHMRLHPGLNCYQCQVCGTGFPRATDYKIHKKSCLNVEKTHFQCHICGVFSKQYAHLELHLLNHSGQKGYFCEFCGKTFIQKNIMKSHMAKCRKGDEKVEQKVVSGFPCGDCGKRFTRKVNLKKHMRNVHDWEPGENDYNSAEAASLESVEEAILPDNGAGSSLAAIEKVTENNFQCGYCDRQFTVERIWQKHTNDHLSNLSKNGEEIVVKQEPELSEPSRPNGEETEQPVSVSKAGFGMKLRLRKINLNFKKKKKIVVKKGNFYCKVCARNFLAEHTYVSHMRVHTGAAPTFFCKPCEKNFTTWSLLSSHRKKHHLKLR